MWSPPPPPPGKVSSVKTTVKVSAIQIISEMNIFGPFISKDPTELWRFSLRLMTMLRTRTCLTTDLGITVR